MSARIHSVIATAIAALSLTGCSDALAPEPVGKHQAAAAIPETGFVPYPILVTSGANPQPILGNSGEYQGAWDGTLADLIAADALALCTVTSGSRSLFLVPPSFAGQDQYLQYLLSKMGEVDCDTQGAAPVEDSWWDSRADRRCNVDSRSGALSRIDALQRDPSTPESFYLSFDFGLSGTTSVLQVAFLLASREMEYADLNLCMAQYMRSQLVSGQSLFSPTQDLTEIQGIIRERAQLASVYYSLISKVISWEGNQEPDTLTSAENDWLVLIRKWATDFASPDELTRLGEDFASAIRLTIESTHDLAATLQRTAGQRPAGEGGVGLPQRDWGAGQPRIRLMNLLYGGDPLGSADPPTRGRGLGGSVSNVPSSSIREVPAFVSATMRDPRVGTFLGLARAADAIRMKVRAEGVTDVGFDIDASAEQMYRSVETELRFQRCELTTPGSCDFAAIGAGVPDVGEFADYVAFQHYGVEPSNATELTRAIAQAFGDLVRTSGSYLEHRRFDGLMHIAGEHSALFIGQEYWILFDKDFKTAGFDAPELGLDYRQFYYLPERLELEADPFAQGFAANDLSPGRWQELRELGAVAALSFVREALADGSLTAGPGQNFFDSASVVLPDLDRELGPRSVIVRPELETASTQCTGTYSDDTCQTLVPVFGATGYKYRVTSVTDGADPMDELTIAPPSPQLHTVARDPATVSFDGIDRATLDAYPTIAADTTPYQGYAASHEKRVFPYELPDSPLRVLLLRGLRPGSTDQVYMPLVNHLLFEMQAYQTSFGGDLHGLAQHAMATLPDDWSRPAFDAFGLPADWVPPADASLVGGTPGEQSYTYYLRVAKQAAQEATAAVQVAIDNLVIETEQQVELENAEQRAETIADIEMSSLCGQFPNCSNIVLQQIGGFAALDCTEDDRGIPLGSFGEAECELAWSQRNAVVPLMTVAKLPTGATTPTALASSFGGEQLRILVRQWNALQQLGLADRAFASNARALGRDTEATKAALTAAESERDAVDADVTAELAALDTTDADIAAQLAELQQAAAEWNAAYDAAITNMERECSSEAWQNAIASGYTYSAPIEGYVFYNYSPTEFEGLSWSYGPAYAQRSLCKQLETEFQRLEATREATVLAMNLRIAALLSQGNLTDTQAQALVERRTAAEDAYNAAVHAASAARQTRWAQLVTSLGQLLDAVGEVVASHAELAQLQIRLAGTAAQANLEKDLAQKQADARFGVRRKFRSYDMWRARALLESARRLAVAARRSIESHFVVDLSELQATQAFVESPALWSDEIYGSDLDAPSVVGLSAAPRIDDAIFPNKLVDYVENLERFVQGYTISYPTALAEPDTEVLTIPGPDLVEPIRDGSDIIEAVAAESTGWTFHCSDTGAWLPHPGIGQVPVVDDLPTLCDGRPPGRARYGFALDPWGRLHGAIAIDPVNQRYNVRWARLAVNLVGTGIRDCALAADPLTCYAEPFLRYNLRHVGPAWTTTHSQDWRAFNMPSALIEGAKALATEEWLDPLTNSWNTPLVSNAARGELFGRSIGGSYEIELELAPEVRLERIERLQLLVQTRYWVRQE